jgi:maltooligosyltrehalose trehalohydrolase
MKRRHNMPYGAEFHDGKVRFRLWAPAAKRVDLCLNADKSGARIPLERQDQGWFDLLTDQAKAGTRYSFRIDDKLDVPDPASRFQPHDVHGPSEVIAPDTLEWRDVSWQGRPWEEAVLYELHVGTFSPSGTFSGAAERLDYLADLGITAIELMPVADFPGKRNWGYDGVFPFAPDSSYGRPQDLKELVQGAHQRGIMVLLDVVYNHFGPDGNYLGVYAPQFFTDRHHTPWGNGINFDGPESKAVRDFFVHNALYWLTEYHFDGLRLDAVHAITDDSTPDILTELAEVVRGSVAPERQIHLILENDQNRSSRLRRTAELCQPREYTAQWNDDIHHALHVLITGERDGYYIDYSENPLNQLGRSLTEGFAYQGEASVHRNGEARGESSDGLPPTAFVNFLQNHDQIGNRAFAERINKLANPQAVRAAAAILLLAPSPPMLFMGDEFGAETPFLFFCDFEKDLAAAVTSGRRNEFAHFAKFSDPAERERIPDPNAIATFETSKLDWKTIDEPRHHEWLAFHRRILNLRRQHIVSRLSRFCRPKAEYKIYGEHGLMARWSFPDESKLTLLANLGQNPLSDLLFDPSRILYASDEVDVDHLKSGTVPAWSVVWLLEE